MSAENRIERARLLYERAVFDGDVGALATADSELDGVEADLALARGRVIHTRFLGQLDEDPERAIEDPRELVLFERAATLYRKLADVRGEAEALFWIGCFHQVVRRDDQTAVPILERSRKLAAQVGDKSTMSEGLRHLGIAEHRAGRLDGARERLEESTRLRREIGLMPGVAANLVGQAYIAAADDRRDYARTLLSEAAAIADATGAHRIMRQVDEARADLRLLEPGDSADEGCDGMPASGKKQATRCMAALGSPRGERPQQDSNLRTRLRRPMLYPLSYGGSLTQKCYQPGAALVTYARGARVARAGHGRRPWQVVA